MSAGASSPGRSPAESIVEEHLGRIRAGADLNAFLDVYDADARSAREGWTAGSRPGRPDRSPGWSSP